jgi:hypothetical protein
VVEMGLKYWNMGLNWGSRYSYTFSIMDRWFDVRRERELRMLEDI